MSEGMDTDAGGGRGSGVMMAGSVGRGAWWGVGGAATDLEGVVHEVIQVLQVEIGVVEVALVFLGKDLVQSLGQSVVHRLLLFSPLRAYAMGRT